MYARKFTLITDHKPLYHIFGEKKGIPIYAANRLQRWAYVLTAFDFDISFVKSGKNAADFLSRIRIGTADRVSTAPQCLNFIYDNCPFNVNRVKIKTQTRIDKILSQVNIIITQVNGQQARIKTNRLNRITRDVTKFQPNRTV